MAEQPSRRPTDPRRKRPSILQQVTQPFRIAWQAFWFYLLSPFRWIRESAERRKRRPAGPTVAQATTRQARYYFLLPFTATASAFRWMGHSLSQWRRSTSLKYFVQGIPAILVTLVAITATTFAYFKPTDRVIDEYETAGKEAIERKDFSLARVCYGKLVQLLGDQPPLLYNLALAEEGMDNESRALDLMDELAPDDNAAGMWEAQLWKGRYYLSQDPATPITLGNAAVNFYRVLARQSSKVDGPKLPKSAVQEAAAGLYEIYANTGQTGQAQQFIAQAQFHKPELKIIYVRGLAASNQEEARRQLPLVRDEYIRILEAEPTNTKIRLALAEAYRLVDDYAAAEKVLTDGQALELTESDQADLKTALANLHILQLQTLTIQKKLNTKEQMRMIATVLDHDPTNVFILQNLYAMTEGNDPEAAREARKLIGEVLAKGSNDKVAPLFHMVQGNYWFSKGQGERARKYLEQAFKLNPDIPELANNYAWMIATTPPNELDHALQIINKVIEDAPNNVQFRDTRGQILMRLGRYEEALADLEFSLREMPTSRTVHRALDTCYRNLNMTEIADEHARIADRITEEISKRRMQQANERVFSEGDQEN